MGIKQGGWDRGCRKEDADRLAKEAEWRKGRMMAKGAA
jgi:hypothetical protein